MDSKGGSRQPTLGDFHGRRSFVSVVVGRVFSTVIPLDSIAATTCGTTKCVPSCFLSGHQAYHAAAMYSGTHGVAHHAVSAIAQLQSCSPRFHREAMAVACRSSTNKQRRIGTGDYILSSSVIDVTMGLQELTLETIKNWGDPDLNVLKMEQASPTKRILTGDIGINGDTLRSSMSQQAFITCRAFLGNQRHSADLFAGSKEFLSSTAFFENCQIRAEERAHFEWASILEAWKSRNIKNSRIISSKAVLRPVVQGDQTIKGFTVRSACDQPSPDQARLGSRGPRRGHQATRHPDTNLQYWTFDDNLGESRCGRHPSKPVLGPASAMEPALRLSIPVYQAPTPTSYTADIRVTKVRSTLLEQGRSYMDALVRGLSGHGGWTCSIVVEV
ncbi:hypothetical protein MRX96_055595 [Rhipicephalus microplus]